MFVYVISGGSFVKIGISKDPNRRLISLQHSNPMTLRLRQTATVPDGDAALIEAQAHGILERQGIHRRGEWFRCAWEVAGRAVTDAVKTAGTIPGSGISGSVLTESAK